MQVQPSKALSSTVAAPASPHAEAVRRPALALFGKGRETNWSFYGALAILLLLTGLLYQSVAAKLVTDWYELPDFSHGFLIPFFAAYLIWTKRTELMRVPVASSWVGLPLVLLGLLLLMTGRFGADLFLSRVSFIVLAAGTIWMLFGRQMLSELKFVLLVLVLAIPLPAVVFNQITFPLQLLASRMASLLLPFAGVPVLREGNVIQLPAMQLEVAEACSGIRSLLSLFTLAVIYGYFLEKSTGRRIVLALASVPIAVAANVARIFGTGLCVQYWDPDKAMGFFHEFSGWLMFLVSLCFLYLVHKITGMLWAGRREAVS
ncbi:MAG TPA: exosortase/archaeosortase family protein [Acidobacteriaceae bacterium]|nr:exosortase/archaeosortase family protein [Acidobacteriaceae bacterium]